MGTDIMGNTGTRASAVLLTYSEMAAIIYDARWMLLLILLCVLADFRYGWGESSRRYARAQEAGDSVTMESCRWRTSRAVRRTINKLVDYLIWVAIGMFTGMAILEPIGVGHIMGGVAATAIAVMCEAKSFFGHFFYLHGIVIEQRTLVGFAKAFAVALAKRKDNDMGGALGEALNNDNNKEERK